MADQQPGEPTPEAAGDPSTVDAPVRWSGSAAVPPPGPKKSRWPRRRDEPDPEPTAVDPHDWAAMPPVDPWAGQDTPWDAFPLAPIDPPAAPLPPTRIDAAPAPVAPAPVPVAPAPPVPKKAPKPPKLSQKANRLPVQARPVPAPPPWAARPQQAPRPLPPPRKKRRWGRRIALLSLLGIVCCCGAPALYLSFPAARQYPVSAVLPSSFADLDRRDDGTSRQAADRLVQQLLDTGAKTDDVFAGVYGDGRGKRVTVFGVTGLRFTPATDVRDQLDRVATDFDLSDVRAFGTGEPGAYERCGTGRSGDTSVVVCAWADHGSLATVLLTRRSMNDSADLVAQLRSAVLTPG
jgi:hypothetical protein